MKKVAFVGQAMPRIKQHPHDWPSLNEWLYSLGLSDDQIKKNFLFTALVDYFPGSAKGGSHFVPTPNEIEKEHARLTKMLRDFNPELIVPVGKLSSSYCLNRVISSLSEIVGKSFEADPYLSFGFRIRIIPLPHPSGASTWRYKPANASLLLRALGLLKEAL